MKKKIYKSLFYILVLAVYGIFFSVQSFFNFEGHSNAKDIFKHSSLVRSSQKHAVVKAIPLNSSPSHNIRLNKRFHQEDITLFPVFCVAAPVLHIIPRVLGSYRDLPLTSIPLLSRPLRGPPVFA